MVAIVRNSFPNFFIVGAPKCGTTSLASWISAHPNIFMCEPKEPYFFSTDIASYRAATTETEYFKLFSNIGRHHLAIGEASTTYLRSKVAVSSIVNAIPAARFIVCLRNPVDMAASVHAQLLKSGRETVEEFYAAWNKQYERQQGIDIPQDTLEPNDLLYGPMCKLGQQVDRLLSLVEREKVLFIFLEDMKNDPEIEYIRALRFLGVNDVNWRSFRVENARRVPRNIGAVKAVNSLSKLKRSFGFRKGTGMGRIMGKWLTTPVDTEKQENRVLPENRCQLIDYYRNDIERLAVLTGRDLGEWLI